MKELRKKTTKPWDITDLRKALKKLKNNKTADPNGMINELFKEGCIGEDLEKALLDFFNGIKETFIIPDFMIKENICTIYKNKGSRRDLENDRGIFILTALKKILDNLIFIEKYDDIDNHMSDSNIGARKGRNVRDHLFVIYGIINSVINGKEACIDIQIYDLEKAFDALWLEDCMIDLFDSLSKENRDEKVALIYETNIKNLVAVNTAVGITERINMPRIVQQGGTWSPTLCSNSVDTIGKRIRDRGEVAYLYKNMVRILPLAMVDDINGISKCGLESIALNTYINTQIEMKKLRFHVPDKQGKSKCHKIHIGKHNKACPVLKVHDTIMEEVTEDIYLGDVISQDGKNRKNVDKRISKGLGLITQIMNMMESMSFGKYYIEIALLLRESIFINGILNNSEVWYGLTTTEINDFENLDIVLLRRILKSPTSTPKEAFYLELGLIPLGVVIKAKRINYLHNIVTRKESEMIFNFFKAQWNNPVRGDWTETVKTDLEDFSISINLEDIKKQSKEVFKKKVKAKAQEYSLNILLEKKETHSKMSNLQYFELKLQTYFHQEGLSIKQIQDVFRFRTRMIQVRENYKGQRGPYLCPLCNDYPDNQIHLFQCKKLNEKREENEIVDNLYTQDVTVENARKVSKILKEREKQLEQMTRAYRP